MQRPEDVPRVGFSSAAHGDNCILFGGRNASHRLLNTAWSVAPDGAATRAHTSNSPPPPREFHTAHTFQGRMLVVLGHLDADTPQPDRHILPYLDLASMSWGSVATTGPAPEPLCHHSSSVYEGTLFVLGGLPYPSNAPPTSSAASACSEGGAPRSPAPGSSFFWSLRLGGDGSNVWRQIQSPGAPSVWGHSTAISGGVLYSFGGVDADTGRESSVFAGYSIARGEWRRIVSAEAVALAGFDAGGSRKKLGFAKGDILENVEPSVKGWSRGSIREKGVKGPSSEGTALREGGEGEGGDIGGTQRRAGWFPSTYAAELKPSQRSLHTLCPLPGGRGVLLWGGEFGTSPPEFLTDCWEYAPATNRWSAHPARPSGAPPLEGLSGVPSCLVGGAVWLAFPQRSEVYRFTPESDVWSRHLIAWGGGGGGGVDPTTTEPPSTPPPQPPPARGAPLKAAPGGVAEGEAEKGKGNEKERGEKGTAASSRLASAPEPAPVAPPSAGGGGGGGGTPPQPLPEEAGGGVARDGHPSVPERGPPSSVHGGGGRYAVTTTPWSRSSSGGGRRRRSRGRGGDSGSGSRACSARKAGRRTASRVPACLKGIRSPRRSSSASPVKRGAAIDRRERDTPDSRRAAGGGGVPGTPPPAAQPLVGSPPRSPHSSPPRGGGGGANGVSGGTLPHGRSSAPPAGPAGACPASSPGAAAAYEKRCGAGSSAPPAPPAPPRPRPAAGAAPGGGSGVGGGWGTPQSTFVSTDGPRGGSGGFGGEGGGSMQQQHPPSPVPSPEAPPPATPGDAVAAAAAQQQQQVPHTPSLHRSRNPSADADADHHRKRQSLQSLPEAGGGGGGGATTAPGPGGGSGSHNQQVYQQGQQQGVAGGPPATPPLRAPRNSIASRGGGGGRATPPAPLLSSAGSCAVGGPGLLWGPAATPAAAAPVACPVSSRSPPRARAGHGTASHSEKYNVYLPGMQGLGIAPLDNWGLEMFPESVNQRPPQSPPVLQPQLPGAAPAAGGSSVAYHREGVAAPTPRSRRTSSVGLHTRRRVMSPPPPDLPAAPERTEEAPLSTPVW